MTQDSGLSYRIMSTQTEKTGGQTEEGSFAARAQSAADMLLKKMITCQESPLSFPCMMLKAFHNGCNLDCVSPKRYIMECSIFFTQDAVKLVQIALDSNATFEDVLPVAEKLCNQALGKVFNYVGTYMCPGLLQSYGPVVITTCMHIRDM